MLSIHGCALTTYVFRSQSASPLGVDPFVFVELFLQWFSQLRVINSFKNGGTSLLVDCASILRGGASFLRRGAPILRQLISLACMV